MQIYADITGRPMKISRSDQTCALGAAIFGAVAAGEEISGFKDTEGAQQVMIGTSEVFEPDTSAFQVYQELYRLYRQVHDAFGINTDSGNLYNVMKDLLALRDRQRKHT